MKRLAYSHGRVICSVALSLATTAACTGGERNQNGCPADEECSPLTPDGMHFAGVSFVDQPLFADPKTTAIGGTQTIDLFKEIDGEIIPLDLPFAAMTDNGDALEVVTAGPNAVVLGGIGSGADLLRITEPDSDLLYDRFEMSAKALDRIDLVPGSLETIDPEAAIAFYEGDVSVGLALVAADGTRLADDSLSLTVSGPQPTRPGWDEFAFDSLGAGTITGELTAGGRSGPFELEVVDAVDTVVPLNDTFPETIRVGNQGDVCFRATAGAYGNVLGVPWSFSATGPVSSVISLTPNCFAVQVNAPGEFSVTATTLGVSGTLVLTAVSGSAKVTAPAPRPTRRATATQAPLRDSRGERARLVAP
jgi:hypothetical protein